MASIGDLFIEIGSKFNDQGIKDADKSLAALGKSTDEAGKKTEASNKLFGGFVITLQDVVNVTKQVGAELFSFLKSAGESELATRQLADAMKAQGIYSEEALKSNQEYAESLMQVTKYDDEAIMSTMKLLTNFGLHGTKLKEVTQATVDLATKTGSLESAAQLLGKATEGETSRLKMHGIVIDESIPKNQRLDAVLKQVAVTYGGAARGEAQTFLGKIQQMNVAWGELKETIGGFIIGPATGIITFWKDAIISLTSALKSTKELSGGNKQLEYAYNALRKAELEYAKTSSEENRNKVEQIKHVIENIKKLIEQRRAQSEDDRKLSWGDIERARANAIEKENLAADVNIKTIQLETTRYEYTIEKQKAMIDDLRKNTKEGTDAYKKYTDELIRLDQMKADKYKGFWDGMTSTVSSNISTIIKTHKNMGDSIFAIWGAIGDYVIDVLAQMIAKAIVYKGIMMTLGGPIGAGLGFLGFDEGGTVPGPRGSPQLIMAHGGETILPTHKTTNTNFQSAPSFSINAPITINGNVDRDNIDEIARKLNLALKSSSIEAVNLAKTINKEGIKRANEAYL